MKTSDIKLICIKCKQSGTYTVYPANITGLIVEVDNLKDAPKELAKLFEVMMEYGFDKGIHEIHELDINE